MSPLRAPLLRTDHRSRSKTIPDQQVNVRVLGSRLDERLWLGHQPLRLPFAAAWAATHSAWYHR